MAGRPTRMDRGSATRDLILDTAERLFAERGIHMVSNRQISDASGQGNSAAVGYHFGTKADLVRAIARRHSDDLERIRVHMVAEAAGSTDIRDWVACLVAADAARRATAVHLGTAGRRTRATTRDGTARDVTDVCRPRACDRCGCTHPAGKLGGTGQQPGRRDHRDLGGAGHALPMSRTA
jgi:AcrR family transcriptional regulator